MSLLLAGYVIEYFWQALLLKKHCGIFIKNASEIALMREANRIVVRILDALAAVIAPGRQTMEFEEIAVRLCSEYGVIPAFKGYKGFPFALCCSINEEVVHGVPSQRKLQEGDLVSFDMGVIYKGFYGDVARTYPVGAISSTASRLLTVTQEALARGIAQCREGNRLYDVSRAIQEYVEAAGFAVVRRFVGHGIGRKLHEKPEVPNFVPSNLLDVVLKAGMVLAIEPMVTVNSPEVEILADRWTAVTKDRSLAGHFEHSVAIAREPQILGIV